MCKKESQGNLEGQGKKLQLTPMYLPLQFDDKIMNSFLKNVLSTEQLQSVQMTEGQKLNMTKHW